MSEKEVLRIKKLKEEAYNKLFSLCEGIVANVLKQDFNKNNIDERMVNSKIVDVISSYIINRLVKGTNSSLQNKMDCNKIINSYLSDKLDKKTNLNISYFSITNNIVRTNEYVRYKFLYNKLKDIQK